MPNEQVVQNYYRSKNIDKTAERQRLLDNENSSIYWKKWGPYLSERQWGTVREDYSDTGDAWNYFSHDQARSRAYRWGEDGIAGISDDHQYLCFSLAMWNGSDPILKERLFGLTNNQGNHGEDVKEYYFYLDSTPTHSYMKYLYKYPYNYPYSDLINKSWSINPYEYELINTGAFDNDKYFDVQVEYAKNTPDDILIRITATNQGAETKTLQLIPTLWYRNTWDWDNDPKIIKPNLCMDGNTGIFASEIKNISGETLLSQRWLFCENPNDIFFTENETDNTIFPGGQNAQGKMYFKNGINNYIVNNAQNAVNPAKQGTKAGALYKLELNPGQTKTICLRLSDNQNAGLQFGDTFNDIFKGRINEADDFYNAISSSKPGDDIYNVQRQAFAGMLWSKQLYYYIIQAWINGDKIPASQGHKNSRNTNWSHMYCKDIMSMPDKWEYPWFAAWDLAFHTKTLALIDPEFAKNQLMLLCMEWYMHPNGQIPAYEWDFNNVNPPVQAWAAWNVYETERQIYGKADKNFLERIFNKFNINFTWWVNKQDSHGNNIFEGGFLGLDNIRIFDRDPSGNPIEQADGTAWMAMFCLNMLKMAVELSKEDPDYQDLVRKYFQHFMYISAALNNMSGQGLWNEEKGFYLDSANKYGSLNVYSAVGLIPMFAIEQITQTVCDSTLCNDSDAQMTNPDSFYSLEGMLKWYIKNLPDLINNPDIHLDDLLASLGKVPGTIDGTVAIVSPKRLSKIISRMLNENEFLSPYGIRALSKYHEHNNTIFMGGQSYGITYEPAESNFVRMMGGNSNWRGPIWMPINYLIVESLQKYYDYLGSNYKVECPTGSGNMMNLQEVSQYLAKRLVSIFTQDQNNGNRPVFGGIEKFQKDPRWNQFVLFYEYFHGGNGAGLGASHQTGWTGLIANLIQEIGVQNAVAGQLAAVGN